ncbi:MAG TPA: phage holin family protein [Beutenbergiaceae bacterium]|nr:phage holin family protein [Beutenbergiaceae bacterium]
MQFIFRVIANAVGIWLASELIGGLSLETDGTWQNTLIVVVVIAAVFTLVNMIIRPIIKFFTFPLYIITLGLFFLVVNALMLMLTSRLTGVFDYGLHIDGFGTAVLASVVISLISTSESALLPSERRRRR